MKAVIFDMDGVIADSEEITYKTLVEYLHKIDPKKEYTRKQFFSKLGKSYRAFWKEIQKDYGLDPEVEVPKYREIQYQAFRDDLQEVPGATEVLKTLKEKKVKLALATSSFKEKTDILIKKLHLNEYFEYILTGDDVKKLKPEPDIFLLAAEKLGEKPENCFVVEDSINGIIAAKKAGCIPVYYRNKHEGMQDHQEELEGIRVITDLKSFLPIYEEDNE